MLGEVLNLSYSGKNIKCINYFVTDAKLYMEVEKAK